MRLSHGLSLATAAFWLFIMVVSEDINVRTVGAIIVALNVFAVVALMAIPDGPNLRPARQMPHQEVQLTNKQDADDGS